MDNATSIGVEENMLNFCIKSCVVLLEDYCDKVTRFPLNPFRRKWASNSAGVSECQCRR